MVTKYLSKIFIFTLVAIGFSACHTEPWKPPVIEPNEPDVDSRTYVKYATVVEGFSGMCLNKDKTALLAVSDKKGIYEISFTGTLVRQLPIFSELPADGADWEGITINHATGEIYLANESPRTAGSVTIEENTVYKLADENAAEVTKVVTLNVADEENKGLEGIAFDGTDNLYIANQSNPHMIIVYSISLNEEVKRITMSSRDFYFLSDICYDTRDNTLWILDSRNRIVTHCDLEGRIIYPRQKVDIDDGDVKVLSPEALIVDSQNKKIYLGSDSTGELFVVDLEV